MSHDERSPRVRPFRRSCASSRAVRRGAATSVGLLALLASLALASTAFAGPKGEFVVFSDCPLGTSGVNECVYSSTTGGTLVFNKLTVPLAKTITLQGGLIVGGTEETFVNAKDGDTLSPVAEEVPGGYEAKPLTLTLELVGPVALSRHKLAKAEGTALKLPLRAHLKNAALGEECFIGSSISPIALNLTTGTTSPPLPNKAISGTPGMFESREAGALEVFKGDSLVENAFSVPAVAGCGGLLKEVIDPRLDTKFGLPSAAGHNAAVLSGASEFATAEAVRKSE